jgi:hypothetical protein
MKGMEGTDYWSLLCSSPHRTQVHQQVPLVTNVREDVSTGNLLCLASAQDNTSWTEFRCTRVNGGSYNDVNVISSGVFASVLLWQVRE